MGDLRIGRLDAAEPFTTKDGSTIREVAGRVSLRTENQSLARPPCRPARARMPTTTASARRSTSSPSGSGRMRLGEREGHVRAGDTVVIAPGIEHKLWASTDEDLVLLCCCAPAYSNEDTVITE